VVQSCWAITVESVRMATDSRRRRKIISSWRKGHRRIDLALGVCTVAGHRSAVTPGRLWIWVITNSIQEIFCGARTFALMFS
jgi:hypothetical protein